MKKILFLDFDGVLHSEKCSKYFSKLELFEQYIMEMSRLEIVISSAWREVYHLEELRAVFNPLLQDRIIGTTPLLECGFDMGGRQLEIEEFLTSQGLNIHNASWIALDDIADFFNEECSFLIEVDPKIGFSDREGRALQQWYYNS